MPKRLIAFAGRKQSGKSTLAAFLIRHYFELLGCRWAKRIGFADPMKRLVADLFDVPWEWLNGTDEDKQRPTRIRWCDLPRTSHYSTQPMTVRQLLQQFGTDTVRAMDPDAWVRYAMRAVGQETELVVMDDVRFPNEVAAVQAAGGKVVRLTRNPNGDEVAPHDSETALDRDRFPWASFDAAIDNSALTPYMQAEALCYWLQQWGWTDADRTYRVMPDLTRPQAAG